MTTPLPPTDLGVRLAEVYHVVGPLYRAAQRHVASTEPVMGMSVGVRAVLDSLRRDSPATVPDLARRLDLSRQFVQRMANDAHDAGWLDFRRNPAHRRSSLLTTTAAGDRAIRRVLDREHGLLGHVGGNLTADDVDTTLRVLHEMLAAVNRLDTSHAADG